MGYFDTPNSYYDLPVITPVFWGGYYAGILTGYYGLLHPLTGSYYGLLRGNYSVARGLLLLTPLY